MLASVAASATVTVTPINTEYSTQKVTFKVEWTNSPTAPYNNRVWIWIDFCPITGTTPGSFAPATVTGATITSGSESISGLTGRGFFITGSTTNSGATVTATLNPIPAGKFNWCVYGSDYPPNATVNIGGGYSLRGTKPFTINGNLTVNANTFGAGTCITSITDPTGRPDGFATPALTVTTSNPDARCGAGAVTLPATASGGTTTAMTYTWIVGGGAARTTTTGSLSHSAAVGSTAYSVTVTNANGCTSTAKTGTITVYNNLTAGAITTASGTTPAGTNPNITIGNSSAAAGGDGTITYQWRRSGTSSATFSYNASTYPLSNSTTNYSTVGTYYFTRYAHDGFCNTAWAASSGQYSLTVSIPNPPNSSGTWSCGTQIWSGALRNPASCTSTSSLSTSSSPPAQYRDYSSSYGFYYNWTCVNTYATTLCPSPWRVPERSDFVELISCTSGSTLSTAWGLPGICYSNTRYDNDKRGLFWSSTGSTAGLAYSFDYSTSYIKTITDGREYGFNVRCVR